MVSSCGIWPSVYLENTSNISYCIRLFSRPFNILCLPLPCLTLPMCICTRPFGIVQHKVLLLLLFLFGKGPWQSELRISSVCSAVASRIKVTYPKKSSIKVTTLFNNLLWVYIWIMNTLWTSYETFVNTSWNLRSPK